MTGKFFYPALALGFSTILALLACVLLGAWRGSDVPDCDAPAYETMRGQRVSLLLPRAGAERHCALPGLYDFHFRTDAFRRRVVPAAPAAAERTVLLLGCSYTFGVGVEDSETFANHLQLRLGNTWRVIDAGIASYGPDEVSELLEDRATFLPGVPDRVDAVIYNFIPDHVLRANHAGRWWLEAPGTSTPWLFRWLVKDWGRYADGARRARAAYFSPDELAAAARSFTRLRKAAGAAFPGARYAVNVWPDDPVLDQLDPASLFRGDEVLRISGSLPRIRHIDHPTPDAHEQEGRFLAEFVHATAQGRAR